MEKRELTKAEKVARHKRIVKRRKIKRASWITCGILIISAIVLFLIVKGFNALPAWALAAIAAVLAVIVLPLAFIAVLPGTKNSAKTVQSVLCVLLSVLFLFGCIKLPGYKGALEKVFVKVPSEGELNIVVYTLNDSGYNSIDELSSSKVAIQSALDLDYQEYAIKVVNKEISEKGGADIKTIAMESIYDAVDALYAGSVDAIMLNESYTKVLEDNTDYKDFSEKVNALYTCTQRISLGVDTANVSDITSEPFIIAITGVDEWGATKASASVRSDVNMLAVVNPSTKQVLIVTIPRDSYVGIVKSNNIIGYDKLTHVTTLSNGINVWIQTLNNLLGTNINYYLRVNYSSVRDIVNAIGGVDLDNPYEFTTKAVLYEKSNGKYYQVETTFKKGTIHVDGEQALGYCRERYSLPNGDLDRNKHQAIVIKACIRKVCSVSTITKIDSLLKAVEGKFTTNLEMNHIYALAQMQLDDMADWDVVQYSMTGSTGWGESYVAGTELSIVNLSSSSINKAKSYITSVLNGEKITIE